MCGQPELIINNDNFPGSLSAIVALVGSYLSVSEGSVPPGFVLPDGQKLHLAPEPPAMEIVEELLK